MEEEKESSSSYSQTLREVPPILFSFTPLLLEEILWEKAYWKTLFAKKILRIPLEEFERSQEKIKRERSVDTHFYFYTWKEAEIFVHTFISLRRKGEDTLSSLREARRVSQHLRWLYGGDVKETISLFLERSLLSKKENTRDDHEILPLEGEGVREEQEGETDVRQEEIVGYQRYFSLSQEDTKERDNGIQS